MMILLRGHSQEPLAKFQPEKLSVNLTERTSTATMTVSEAAPDMACGDWMKMEDGPGAGIVWRIKSIDHAFEKQTRTVNLEHIISILKDWIMPEEVKGEDISGSSKTDPTNLATAKHIMDYQHDWVVRGVAGGGEQNPYSFSSGTTLFSALETVSGSITDSIWQYDMSGYPFILDIGHLTGQVSSEMRTDRNIRTLKKTVDRSGMYTRFYPIGKDDLRISGDYIQMNENLYGTICKSETNQSYETEDALIWWARDRLKRHSEPKVTITISGLDLAQATGEEMDTFQIGYLCRVPLPEFNTTITERIIKLSYSDVIKDPTNVTVTLANELTDLASIISTVTSSVSSSAATTATDNKEKNAWIDQTDDHIYLVARAVAGEDEDGVNWSRVSKIGVDGTGIHGSVTMLKGEMVQAQTRIDATENEITLEATRRAAADTELTGRITVEANRITQEVTQRKNDVETLSGRLTVEADRITQEVTDRTKADGVLSGKITTEAGRITAEVTRAKGAETALSGRLTITENAITQEVTDRTNADNTLSGRITTNANKVAIVVEEKNGQNVVKAASIVTAINNSESSVTLDADKVYIGNEKSTTVIAGKCSLSDVTADYISGKVASLSVLNVKAISSTGNISTSNGYVMAPYIYLGTAGNARSLSGSIWALQITQSGNTYTLKKQDYDDSDWVDVGTFSRAVTSWTMGWSGGTFTARANPQNQSCTTQIVQGATTWSGNSATVTVEAIDSDNPGYQYATGRSILVDATARYNAGFDATHTVGIYDSSSNVITSRTLSMGTSLHMWGGMGKSDGSTFQWGSEVVITAENADYWVNDIGTGRCNADQVDSYLAGWNPQRITGIGDSQMNTYRCIWFKVDGAKRSFYFS